jgi:hypothetical protein
MNKFQLFKAQFGRDSEREATVKMLLRLDELPWSGWVNKGTNSWRTGAGDIQSETYKRAHDVGSFVTSLFNRTD